MSWGHQFLLGLSDRKAQIEQRHWEAMEDRIRAPERSRNSAVTFAREMKRKPLKKRQGIRISRSHVKWKESLQKRGREFGSHVKREQKESLQKRQGIGSHVRREKDQGLDPDTLRLLDSTSFLKIDSFVLARSNKINGETFSTGDLLFAST